MFLSWPRGLSVRRVSQNSSAPPIAAIVVADHLVDHGEEVRLLDADIEDADHRIVRLLDDRLVDGEIGDTEDVGGAGIGAAFLEDGVIGCALRQLGSDRAPAIRFLDVGRDARVAHEHGRGAAGERFDLVDGGKVAVDQLRAEIELVALQPGLTLGSEDVPQQVDVDGQAGLSPLAHGAVGGADRDSHRCRDRGREDGEADDREPVGDG